MKERYDKFQTKLKNTNEVKFILYNSAKLLFQNNQLLNRKKYF